MPRIVIKSTNFRPTAIMREYIERKAQKLERFTKPWGSGVICRIEVGKSTRHHRKGKVFRTEVNCDIPALKTKVLRAESVEQDWRASFDRALDEIVRQLTKARERLYVRYKSGAREMKRRIHEDETP